MSTLVEAFDALPVPTGRPDMTIFSARPAAGAETHRVAKQVNGAPALLISVGAAASTPRPASVELENIQIQHDLECVVSQPDGGQERGRFSVILCKGEGRELHAYFLRVSGPLLQVLGASPTRAQVSRAIDQLVELFSAMSLPSRKSVQGLWAEVFLIARASEPATLIEAWHANPEDRYDFGTGSHRIEVKSCTGAPRRHHFTLEQLTPPPGVQVIVASIFAQRTGNGASIADFIDRLRESVHRPELILRLERLVAMTLGDCWPNGLRDHFDEQVADDSLRFYRSRSVPSIASALPVELTQVRFVSDMSGAEAVQNEELQEAGGILSAAR